MDTDDQQYILDRIVINNQNGCWIWNKYVDNVSGYGSLGRGRMWKKYGTYWAHKLSYLVFVGDIADTLLVRHKCKNRSCCNPEHLELGSRQDNSDDRYRDGTDPKTLGIGFNTKQGTDTKGEKNKHAKLTAEQVLEIRRLSVAGTRRKELSSKYDVSLSLIDKIVNRQQWTHI